MNVESVCQAVRGPTECLTTYCWHLPTVGLHTCTHMPQRGPGVTVVVGQGPSGRSAADLSSPSAIGALALPEPALSRPAGYERHVTREDQPSTQ